MLEKNLKQEYIHSIITLGERFKQIGLLENYCKKQSELFSKLKIKGFEYPLKSDEQKNLGVEDLFVRENLEKLHVNQLAILNSFWLNRFTKEMEAINKSFFISKNLGILGEIKEAIPNKNTGFIRINIEEEKLKYLYEKMNYLEEVLGIIFQKLKKSKYKSSVEEFVENGKKRLIRKVNPESIFLEFEKDTGKEYKDYFSNKQPQVSNDLLTDINNYRIMDNAIRNIYKSKDSNMIAILSNLYNLEFSKNWGIVPEKNIEIAKKILIAVDLRGLNMPIRLHIDKNVVEDFLKANQNTTMLTVYEGKTDFNLDGTFISTNVLMPLCDKQKEAIKTAMEDKTHPYRNLVEHLYFLVDGEYPEHLKVETIVKKKGKIKVSKKIPPRRYIDLSTGDEYLQNKNGEFEKIEKENKKTVEVR